MAKRYDVCALCGSRALLNYAMLCKRCNKAPGSTKIKQVIFKHEHEMIEEAKEDAKQAAEDASEAAAEKAAGEKSEDKVEKKKEKKD